ncbi:MAG: PIN domain-containing protein [Mycobacteriales bacterium]
MTVLDAFAVIAFLRDEPARDEVETLLRAAETCRTSVVNLAEIIDVLGRSKQLDARMVKEQLRLMEVGGLRFEPVDARSAELAGNLRAQHYRRSDCAISVADCFALALTTMTGERLATADAALLGVATKVGARFIALPDSSGRRPQV